MLQSFTLKNGIRVASYNLPDLKSIHIRISVKGGSIVENKKNTGVAHFMEHMLVQGIPSYPTAEDFSRYIEGLAGSYGAYTEKLGVSFYITIPATHVEDAVRITSEVFYRPIFAEDAIEKERIAIIDEVGQKRDSHWHKISKHFLQARFQKNHPLLLDGGGEIPILKKLTKDDLFAYWERYFKPKNTYILVSGNFKNSQLVSLLEKYFEAYTDPLPFAGFPHMDKNDFTKRSVVIKSDKKLSTCYVDLTFPSIDIDADIVTRVKQNLALVILGQLRNSRLFKLLRYRKGLVYDVRAGNSTYPGLGYAYASLEVGREYLDEAVELVVDELAAFTKYGPTDEELTFAKNYLTNQWLMAFDHPTSIASWVENHLLWDDRILLPEDYAALIKDITSDDLVDMMRTHWDFQNMNLIVQGPLKNTASEIEKFTILMNRLLPDTKHRYGAYPLQIQA